MSSLFDQPEEGYEYCPKPDCALKNDPHYHASDYVHQHSFTVAVEWVPTDFDYGKPKRFTVTKLRCSTCTEEIKR